MGKILKTSAPGFAWEERGPCVQESFSGTQREMEAD